MRYWLFQSNQVVGPYDREELSQTPGFSPESLVCPEGRRGTQMGDWQRAGVVAELADTLLKAARVPAGVGGDLGGSLLPPEPTLRDLAMLGTLQEKVELLENALNQVHEELRQRDDELAALRTELDTQGTERAQLEGKLAELENRVAEAQTLREEVERAQESGQHQSESIDQLRSQLDTLRHDLETRPEPAASPRDLGLPEETVIPGPAGSASGGTLEISVSPAAAPSAEPAEPEAASQSIPDAGPEVNADATQGPFGAPSAGIDEPALGPSPAEAEPPAPEAVAEVPAPGLFASSADALPEPPAAADAPSGGIAPFAFAGETTVEPAAQPEGALGPLPEPAVPQEPAGPGLEPEALAPVEPEAAEPLAPGPEEPPAFAPLETQAGPEPPPFGTEAPPPGLESFGGPQTAPPLAEPAGGMSLDAPGFEPPSPMTGFEGSGGAQDLEPPGFGEPLPNTLTDQSPATPMPLGGGFPDPLAGATPLPVPGAPDTGPMAGSAPAPGEPEGLVDLTASAQTGKSKGRGGKLFLFLLLALGSAGGAGYGFISGMLDPKLLTPYLPPAVKAQLKRYLGPLLKKRAPGAPAKTADEPPQEPGPGAAAPGADAIPAADAQAGQPDRAQQALEMVRNHPVGERTLTLLLEGSRPAPGLSPWTVEAVGGDAYEVRFYGGKKGKRAKKPSYRFEARLLTGGIRGLDAKSRAVLAAAPGGEANAGGEEAEAVPRSRRAQRDPDSSSMLAPRVSEKSSRRPRPRASRAAPEDLGNLLDEDSVDEDLDRPVPEETVLPEESPAPAKKRPARRMRRVREEKPSEDKSLDELLLPG